MILSGSDRRYDNQDDAALRLFKTICMYQGYPLYITTIAGFSAEAWDLINDRKMIIDVNDTDLDLTPPHIGYISPFANKGSVYPIKPPLRKQRQGIDVSNLSFFAPHSHDFQHLVPDLSVVKSVQAAIVRNRGEHPVNPVSRQVDEIRVSSQPSFSRPISSDMALTKTKDKSVLLLWHKNYPLGYYIPNECRWILPESRMTETRHEHLQNILKKETRNHEVQSHP